MTSAFSAYVDLGFGAFSLRREPDENTLMFHLTQASAGDGGSTSHVRLSHEKVLELAAKLDAAADHMEAAEVAGSSDG